MKAPKYLFRFLALAALAVALTATVLLLAQFRSQPILLADVTAAAIEGEPDAVAVYARLVNDGGPDRLVAARSITAQRARLDGSVADAGLPVPAESAPALAADGAHIRLDGIGGNLREGRTIPVTLRFERSGEMTARARVGAAQTPGQASSFGLFGLGDICRVEDGEPAPKVSLSVRPEGDGWIVTVHAEDFTFSRDMLDGPHVPGTGHGHLYVGGLKLQRLFESTVRIGALPAGTHEVRVTLNTNDHRAYVVGDTPVTATIRIVAN